MIEDVNLNIVEISFRGILNCSEEIVIFIFVVVLDLNNILKNIWNL